LAGSRACRLGRSPLVVAASARDSGSGKGTGGMRRHHDMGGEPAGPVERTEHDYAHWEKRVDAILRLLVSPPCKVMTVDELRRGIEELGPGAYDELSYYQRWIASIANNLLEKGVVTVDELGRRLAEVEARWRAEGRAAPGAGQ
jgi:hypothetical protein